MRISEAPPRFLYHYTTAAGFRGIVEQNLFHATNFRFLNDSTELEHGVEFIRREIAAGFPSLASNVLSWDRTEMRMTSSEVWVACFSELRDDLNQWRSYGGNADRYCICIDTTKLNIAVNHHMQREPQWMRVLYTENDKQVAIAAARRSLQTSGGIADNVGLEFYIEVTLLYSAMKHETYQAEREWRVVIHTRPLRRGEKDSPVRFKDGLGHIRPFIEVRPASGELPIHEVLFLPRRGGAAQCQAAAYFLLTRHGYLPSILRASSVPFVD